MKLPYMPFYGFDYETDSRCKLLSDVEHGVYFRLLWEQWKEGSVPADPAVAAELIRSKSLAAVAKILGQFFVERTPGNRVNEKLFLIRRALEAEREAKSIGGKRGRNIQLVADYGLTPDSARGISRAQPGQPEPEPEPRTTFRGRPDPDVVAILQTYQALHQTRRPFEVPGIPKVSAHKAVKKALNWGFTVEQLQAALRANAEDPWHAEHKKHELEYVLRTEDKVCGWIERAEATNREVNRDVYGDVTFDSPGA